MNRCLGEKAKKAIRRIKNKKEVEALRSEKIEGSSTGSLWISGKSMEECRDKNIAAGGNHEWVKSIWTVHDVECGQNDKGFTVKLVYRKNMSLLER